MESPMRLKVADYQKSLPSNPKEWKKWKEDKKQKHKKWKEEKLIKKMEKQNTKKSEEDKMELVKEINEDKINKIGRNYTVSIALPGSILDNTQSQELRTYLAGQIARAAVVFGVDEIIVFDETKSTTRTENGEYLSVKGNNGNIQLARILQYLECPQYLRKQLFPQHRDLKYAGLLNPLDSPHHMRADQQLIYREGVVLDKPVKPGKGSLVNIGLKKDCQIDKCLQKGLRVTVQLKSTTTENKKLKGKVVSPATPRVDAGLYWGYSTRLAGSLSDVFTQCPYKEGYDVMIGTSEKGSDVDDFEFSGIFRHLLVVFGGVQGLETSLEADEKLKIDDASLLFNYYLNTCPGQSSGTIRTEEAILISLSALRSKIYEIQGKVPQPFNDSSIKAILCR